MRPSPQILILFQDEVFDDADSSTGATTTEDQIREIKEQQEVVMKQTAAAVTQDPVVKETISVGGQHTNGSYEETGVSAAMEVEEPISEWKEPSAAPATFVAEQQWKTPEPAAEPAETGAAESADVDEEEAGDQESAPASDPGPRTWSSMVKSAPGKPPLAPQNSLGAQPGAAREGGKEGTPFSQGSQTPAGRVALTNHSSVFNIFNQSGAGKQGAGQGGYQRGQRGSSQGRSPGQAGSRSERFSKEEGMSGKE